MNSRHSPSFSPSFSVESLEKRTLLSAVPIAAKIKVAEVTDSDGNPLGESRVTVRFTAA